MAAAFVAATVLVSTATADANSVPTTGSRISLFAGPTQYPALTPFYGEQGFICPLGNVNSCMNSDFVLTVDGQKQQAVTDIDELVRDGTTYLQRDELTDFATGLTAGTHTLTGYWRIDVESDTRCDVQLGAWHPPTRGNSTRGGRGRSCNEHCAQVLSGTLAQGQVPIAGGGVRAFTTLRA